MRALSVSPADRFATCAEFARAIEAVAIGRVATHAEVLQHFSTRHQSMRPSLFPAVPQAPSHKSSLSALVSPVQPVTDAPPSEPGTPQSGPLAAQTRTELRAEIRPLRRRLVVALLSVAAAFAVGAGIRYQARSSITVAADRGAPLANEILPRVAPLAANQSKASPSGLSRSAPAPAVPTAVSAVPAANAVPALSAAAHRAPPDLLKSLAPHPNVAAKPGRKRTKEAELYGI
jgi:hypothetical protein